MNVMLILVVDHTIVGNVCGECLAPSKKGRLMPLQRPNFYLPAHPFHFPVAAKSRCPLVSHPTTTFVNYDNLCIGVCPL